MNLTDILGEMTTNLTGIEILTSDSEAIMVDMRDSLAVIDYSLMRSVVR